MEIRRTMKFKVGDKIEFDATVSSILPQNEVLIVGLKVTPALVCRCTISKYSALRPDRSWKGRGVRITAKVTSVRNTERARWSAR